MTKPERILRLHTDNRGQVWYGDDTCLGACSDKDVASFLEEDPEFLAQTSRVRVLGTVCNADLIIGLHQRRRRLEQRQVIELGSPLLCQLERFRSAPLTVLQCLWQFAPGHAEPEQWHVLSDRECAAYLLARFSRINDNRLDARAQRVFRYHPAWPAVSFLPHVHLGACIRLLTCLLDPRWFRHPTQPQRLSRVWSYLGLNMENAAACAGVGRPQRHHVRAATAIASWYQPSKADASLPGGFLWRLYGTINDPPTALLQVTKKFLEFVIAVWLGELANHPEVRFQPSRFFDDDVEARAYTAHHAATKAV